MAAVAVQSVADVENVEKASEPKDEEIDFESWFFEELIEEPVEKEIGVVRCEVADEKKPQESTELKAITKEGDDDEMTHGSIVVVEKTAGREFVQVDATHLVNCRHKIVRRRLVPRQCENNIPEPSILKMTILEGRAQMFEQLRDMRAKILAELKM